MKNNIRNILLVGAALTGGFVLAQRVANVHPENESIVKNNSYKNLTLYEKVVKPALDKVLSFAGLVVLSPLMAGIAAAVFIDDPGPVFFTQMRVGKDKRIFKLHKYRTMKMFTPHDVPTHQLENPEQYITCVGRVLRRTSLDELPQIWDIFRGRMSIIGPRPALWNQKDLVAQRDKWNANSILPGLTGLAQIKGRDKLLISEKAKLDGKYVKKLKEGGLKAFFYDVQLFFWTVASVLRHDGIVEGSTGFFPASANDWQSCISKETAVQTADEAGFEEYAFKKKFDIDKNRRVKVLITGARSYIGESFREYCSVYYPNIELMTIDMVDDNWREHDFKPYDTIFHVAGIAHADIENVDEAVKAKYYTVNTGLVIETAQKAKASKVKQFIFLSSMIVYGGAEYIDEYTVPHPVNFYGDSKWKADKGVRKLANSDFKVAVLRLPMVYGKGSKGNYLMLAKIAKKMPVFPEYDNKRSMIYIDNLCEFVAKLVLSGSGGIYFPQNAEYTKTDEMASSIAAVKGTRVRKIKSLNLAIYIAQNIPGKIGNLAEKAFGSSYYSQKLSHYDGLEYQKVSLRESIVRTEGADSRIGDSKRKHILLISQYFYPETFRVNDMAVEWVKRGYKVTVLTGIPNYPMGQFFDGYGYKRRRREIWNGVEIIRIPIIPRGNSSNKLLNAAGMLANYLSFVASGRRWVEKVGKCNNFSADLVFTVEVSPMTQALIGCWYGKKHDVPVYLYVQDLWPENVETVTGVHSKAALEPIGKMVRWIYKNTDQIFTTSPSFVKKIVKHGVEESKVHYWPQYAEEFYKPISRSEAEKNLIESGNKELAFLVRKISGGRAFYIAFTGNIGTAQGLDILPKVAERLKTESQLLDFHSRSICFIIVGDGRYQEKLKAEIEKYSVANMFIFVPRQRAEVIPSILSLCDAAFLSFSPDKLWEMTIPAKLQSYMACGMPIIAAAAGETERVVKESGCGVCSPIGDSVALAKAIKKMSNSDMEKMKKNSREYAEKNFDKSVLMNEMETMLCFEKTGLQLGPVI